MEMEYRRLGHTGLKVSVLSFGSWVTFGPQLAGSLAEDCLAAAYDAGVNFFDNAEAYSAGESERIMGEAIASLGLAPPQLRPLHQAVLGHPRGRQHAQHPQSQVPAAGHRRFAWSAWASTSSTSSTATVPTPRHRSRKPCGPCPT